MSDVPSWITEAVVIDAAADHGDCPAVKYENKFGRPLGKPIASHRCEVGKYRDPETYCWEFKDVKTWDLYEDGVILYYDFNRAMMLQCPMRCLAEIASTEVSP